MRKNTYIPFNSAESASLKDPKTILAKNVYSRLEEFINLAVEKIKTETPSNFNDSRSHKAISIDGARGTGKTSVLVNLKSYIRENNRNLLNDIHILEPIDPTLLEDGESLFLHIIVAAILHDDEIKKAQSNCFDKSRYFSQCLEELASGLESIDLQKELHGMDKIRSLYGNKHLAKCVEKFFCASLELLDRKLFILPIDDVDTSLNNAFENLEILRRYLTTPYILPIVSGDRQLYDEVCWRDFHGRLISDSIYEKNKAAILAKDLALEYQRKILPLPRRLNMPEVNSYWKNNDVKLGSEDGIPLSNFIAWLNIFIAGPVNGLENSSIDIPIPSIRALTQLINHCGPLISELPDAIKNAKTPLEVKQHWQMPNLKLSLLNNFNKRYQEINNNINREYKDVYDEFYKEYKDENPQSYSIFNLQNNDEIDKNIILWNERLSDYFYFEPDAGAIYLILKAQKEWKSWKKEEKKRKLPLSTLLFQPLNHEIKELENFKKIDDLSDWAIYLEKRLPSRWLRDICKKKTILPYPVAEVGISSSIKWRYWENAKELLTTRDNNESNAISTSNIDNKAILLISLLLEYNFYSNTQQTLMINIGRIFEIIITSLIVPLEFHDLQQIKQLAPFFSTRELAPTKVLDNSDSEQSSAGESNSIPEDILNIIDSELHNLYKELKIWYDKYNIKELNISPWLVYKVFNKVYNQIANNSGQYKTKSIKDSLILIRRVFYITWSAFGSFEKGEIFGLPEIIATTNISSLKDFEKNPHYLINLRPFVPRIQEMEKENYFENNPRKLYGENTKTVSYFLVEHPIRKWIDDILSKIDQEHSLENECEKYTSAKEMIISILKLPKATKSLQQRSIIKKLKSNNWTKDTFEKYLEKLENLFPRQSAVNTYKQAGQKTFLKENN